MLYWRIQSLFLWAGLGALLLVFGCQPTHTWRGELLEPQPAPPLEGTHWSGKPFELTQLQGQVAIVFYGYTYCPDVCPFALYKMKQLYAELGERAEELAVVFVSVDPQRDTVEKLASYVPGFDPRFHGIRIEPENLEAVKEAWGLTVQYGQPKDGPGTESYYYVDHTGSYFVVDHGGQLLLEFPPNATVEDLATDLAYLIESEAPSKVPKDSVATASTSSAATAAAQPSPPEIRVEDARVQMVPGGSMAAIYGQIKSSDADRLMRVETDWAQDAQIHETVDDDGILRMVARPEGFSVSAREPLALDPGGRHIMLIEPRPPRDAEAMPVTFHFEKAGAIEVLLALGGSPVEDHQSSMDHSSMDHSSMEMDHGSMDHSSMDHSSMDHSAMDHSAMEDEGIQ